MVIDAVKEVVSTGITFEVDRVTKATEPLREVPYELGLNALVRGKPTRTYNRSTGEYEPAKLPPLESYSKNTHPLVWRGSSTNALMSAFHYAYNDHRPLVLSPDMIWFMIINGVSEYINKNAENLRHRFVSFDGKKKLVIRRDEFVKGFMGNDWEGGFAEWSGMIKTEIGESNHSLIVQEYSTTSFVDRAALEVALMGAMQSYFDYGAQTMCGIPEITLEGTPEDWNKLHANTERVAHKNL